MLFNSPMAVRSPLAATRPLGRFDFEIAEPFQNARLAPEMMKDMEDHPQEYHALVRI